MSNFNLLSTNDFPFSQVNSEVFDFGVGKYQVFQRFNDPETDISLLSYYTIWLDGHKRIGHDGLDMVKLDGDNIYAFEGGEVVYADWDINSNWKERAAFMGGGIMTFVWNKPNSRLWTYLHLASNIGLQVGQVINRGDFVGIMGGSGNGQFNANPIHLHLGLYSVDNNCDIINRDNGFIGAYNPAPTIISLLNQNSDNNQNNNTEQPMSMQEKIEVSKNAVTEFFTILRNKNLPLEDKDFGRVQGLINENSINEAAKEFGDYLTWKISDFKNKSVEAKSQTQSLLTSIDLIQKNEAELQDKLSKTLFENQVLDTQLKEAKENYTRLLTEITNNPNPKLPDTTIDPPNQDIDNQVDYYSKEAENQFNQFVSKNNLTKIVDMIKNNFPIVIIIYKQFIQQIKNVLNKAFKWWNSTKSNRPIIVTAAITAVGQFFSTNGPVVLTNLSNQYYNGQIDGLTWALQIATVFGFNIIPSTFFGLLSYTDPNPNNPVKYNNLINFIKSFLSKKKSL